MYLHTKSPDNQSPLGRGKKAGMMTPYLLQHQEPKKYAGRGLPGGAAQGNQPHTSCNRSGEQVFWCCVLFLLLSTYSTVTANSHQKDTGPAEPHGIHEAWFRTPSHSAHSGNEAFIERLCLGTSLQLAWVFFLGGFTAVIHRISTSVFVSPILREIFIR